MIALDAAEPSLVERWMMEGTLSNLRRLRDRGAFGRLSSPATYLAGSPWPTFYTGTSPAEHGFYHVLQWRAERMGLARVGPDWLPLRPFWREAAFADRRVVALDVPSIQAPGPFNGLEISGWASHDQLHPPASYPAEAIDWVRREFGPTPLSAEVYGPQRVGTLLRQRDELIRATERVTDVGRALMEREPWDLFMIAYGAAHRGGHKLWDESGARGSVSPADGERLSAALWDVYTACDAAVGRLVEAVGEEATVLVLSLHGMGPNTCRANLLPAMLDRILAGEAPDDLAGESSEGLLRRLRGLVPIEWRQAVKSRLPASVQDRLTSFWRMSDIDLSKTRAFSLIADLQGYVRINLKGREARGVVEPGAEYEELCARITDGLSSFVDIDTGRPLVAEVLASRDLFTRGRRLDALPDLIIRWSDEPAKLHRAVVSERFGTLGWPTPGRNPDGRSGNHRGEGFVLAAGGGIAPARRIAGAGVVDLAPTLAALLGLDPLPTWSGRAIDLG